MRKIKSVKDTIENICEHVDTYIQDLDHFKRSSECFKDSLKYLESLTENLELDNSNYEDVIKSRLEFYKENRDILNDLNLEYSFDYYFCEEYLESL